VDHLFVDPSHQVVYPFHRASYPLDHPSLPRREGHRVYHHPSLYLCELDHPVYLYLDRGDRRVGDFSYREYLYPCRDPHLCVGHDLGHHDETILLVLAPVACLQVFRLDQSFEAGCQLESGG
jgi:hypothetical protein